MAAFAESHSHENNNGVVASNGGLGRRAGSSLADAAIALGLPVFPCRANKRPLTEHGFKDATTDPAEIRRLFSLPGAALIGVPTGAKSGLSVVDLDVKEERSGLAWLEANACRLPRTRRHRTRSGGAHLLFCHPVGRRIRNSASKLAPGVDIRGEGGYVVFPPSEGYVIEDDAKPADMPAWLLDLLDPPEIVRPPAPPPRPEAYRHGDGTPWGLAALAAECSNIRGAGPGQKHHTLNRAAYSIGGLVAAGEIGESAALDELRAAVASIRDRCADFKAAERTLAQAFRDGKDAPRSPPPPREAPLRQARPRLEAVREERQAKHEAAPRDAPPEPEEPEIRPEETPRKRGSNQADGRELTEDSVALDFAAEHAGRVVFDHTERRWAAWDGSRWQRDGKERVFDGVREYVRRLREGRDAVPAALARMGFASAVERGVRADPRIAVEHDVWDADPWTLGVPGGVVDLRTGKLRAGRPEEYVSRQTSVAPAAPGTAAPLWRAFLSEATGGDAATIAFLRRLLGYSLTGDVSEEMLAFLYGDGGNGKGVFLSAWTAIMGDYAVAMPMEAFTANGGVRLEYYRAQMAGHRLVTASETETGAAWAESQIKELTGNEAPVSARHPHGRPFTYRPQFKLAIVGNHAPRLKGRSAAMERRLRVVPFNRKPPAPDHELKAKLRAEYPAILRWMVDGCLEWQCERLGTSPAIAKATGSYFEAQDAFGRWLEEACILGPNLSTKPAPLLAAFGQWARASGEEVPSSGAFAELVDRHPALTRTKSNGDRLVKGIGLRAASEGRAWRDD